MEGICKKIEEVTVELSFEFFNQGSIFFLPFSLCPLGPPSLPHCLLLTGPTECAGDRCRREGRHGVKGRLEAAASGLGSATGTGSGMRLSNGWQPRIHGSPG